ncbi:MAG TPA: YjgN family protein [Arenimonas sp.]|uniref:YjgN family protein n=1 Tax=Arenimonas sp. TaxID=1872635 RepID=UPI002D7EB0A2|nr:YjgN family protein [Arenimonas sp.]HEU0151797.1 YjgN family protein [Arenimonas sp.]
MQDRDLGDDLPVVTNDLTPPVLPPSPAMPPPVPGPVRHPLQFTGRAGEFFGIWFVNLVLSVLTLGIYSAWAKVRTERYFYGNTRLAGAPFEYLAQPIAILKGRLIAYAVAIGLGLSAHFQVWVVYIPLILLVLALFPWLIQRTLRFRARYSAWRGLRFRFVEGVYEAYVNFMFRPALQIPTAYMVLPWVRMHQHDYTVTGHRFGGKRFRFQGDLGTYYIPFLVSIGLGFGAYVLMFAGAVGIGMMHGALSDGAGSGGAAGGSAMAAVLVPIVVVYLALLALPIYLRTKYINLMWRYASLGGHRFECTLRARDMIWIYFSNGVAIVASVGLLVPWAMIRIARYRAQHFALLADGDLDHFVAEGERAEGAAGAELMDALDLDVDIGI